MPSIPQRDDASRSFISERFRGPVHFLGTVGINLDEPLIAPARWWCYEDFLIAYIRWMQMFSDSLHDKMTDVDRVYAASSDPGLSVVQHDRVIGAMAADVRIAQRANPNARPVGNRLLLPEGDTFFPCVEIDIVASGLDRFGNHRPVDRPFGQNFHAAGVNRDRAVKQHGLEPWDVFLFDPAHPPVIAGVANRVDRLLGVLAGDDGTVRFLNVDGCELHDLVHPIRPKVLLATGFVVAKDATRRHTRSILAPRRPTRP